MYIKNGRGENIMDKDIKLQLVINKMMGLKCIVMNIPSISPCSMYRDNCFRCPYYNGRQ